MSSPTEKHESKTTMFIHFFLTRMVNEYENFDRRLLANKASKDKKEVINDFDLGRQNPPNLTLEQITPSMANLTIGPPLLRILLGI